MDQILVEENNVQNLSISVRNKTYSKTGKEIPENFIKTFSLIPIKANLKNQNARRNESIRIKKLYLFLKHQLNKYDPYFDQRLNSLVLSLDLANNISIKIGQFCCALGNIDRFLDLFAAITKDPKFKISVESLEVLMSYCIPLLNIDPKQKCFDFIENQLVLYDILRASMIRYSKMTSTVPKLVLDAMNIFINISKSDHPTLSIGAYRALHSFLISSVRYFDTPKLFECLEYMSQQLSENHMLRPIFIHGLNLQMPKIFDSLRYVQTLIIERKFSSLSDFSLLEKLLQENKFASFPFSTMRFLIQTHFFGNEYSKTAFLIIEENIHYFDSCQRLCRWTNNFVRNAFQWFYYVTKNHRYANRCRNLLVLLKKFEQLNIPTFNITIDSCASSLQYLIKDSMLSRLWEKKVYDEKFIKDLEHYLPDSMRLKHTLLWPPEQQRPRNRNKNGLEKQRGEVSHNRSKRGENIYSSEDEDLSDPIDRFDRQIKTKVNHSSESDERDTVSEIEHIQAHCETATNNSQLENDLKQQMKTPMKIIITIFVTTIVFHILAGSFVRAASPVTMLL